MGLHWWLWASVLLGMVKYGFTEFTVSTNSFDWLAGATVEFTCSDTKGASETFQVIKTETWSPTYNGFSTTTPDSGPHVVSNDAALTDVILQHPGVSDRYTIAESPTGTLTLTITDATPEDNGSYGCRKVDSTGNELERSSFKNITVYGDIPYPIWVHGVDNNLSEGETVTMQEGEEQRLSCVLNDIRNVNPEVTMTVGDYPQNDDSTDYTADFQGSTDSSTSVHDGGFIVSAQTVTFSNNNLRKYTPSYEHHNKKFVCEASVPRQASKVAYFIIDVLFEPKEAECEVSGENTITCEVYGNPAPELTFTGPDNSQITDSASVSIETQVEDNGKTVATLTLNDVPIQYGQYQMEASNTYGTAQASVNLSEDDDAEDSASSHVPMLLPLAAAIALSFILRA